MLAATIDAMLWAGALVLLLPVAVFSIEVWVAALAPRRAASPCPPHEPLAVLMPAHDEAAVIPETLQRLRPQLRAGDRVLVVADNCSDETAAIARREGAEVVERFNSTLRGKGYALDHGVRELSRQPPACVVILDADCVLHEGALDRLAACVAASGAPSQALYLMQREGDNRAVSPVAVFAWRVRNLVRPLGLSRLGGPCHLTGSGMAFPWPLLRDLPLASGHLVEDMKMGVDLARSGHPPVFCPQALVTSSFAANREGATAQRTRWEHGTLGMLFGEVPGMLRDGLLGRGRGLLPLALDMTVPPLALLAMLLLVLGAAATGASLLLGHLGAALLVAVELLLFFGALFAAWLRYGQDLIAFRDIPAMALYPFAKLPLYVRFLFKRQMAWVRTKRTSE